jgi:glycosyltransferase involved in cell wall biosynthesis
MRVACHDYTINNAIGGALYNYSEIASILSLSKEQDLIPCKHNVFDLIHLGESEIAKFITQLTAKDIVVGNVGPLSYLYYYWREIYQAEFNIIRDVRTSSWAPYWLQEVLCGPLTRTNDRVIFPSYFCRDYYLKLFPRWLCQEITTVCYPLTHSFPEKIQFPQSEKKNNKDRDYLHIGYLGRMSHDKNIKQVFSIAAAIEKQGVRQIKLHLAGAAGKRFQRDHIVNVLKEYDLSEGSIVYHGRLSYKEIWQVYKAIDCLLFPAVASVESLGRVLLEASHMNVPVIAADYAAAPEILPAENIVKTDINFGKVFDARITNSLGRINEEDAIERILSQCNAVDIEKMKQYGLTKYFALLRGEKFPDKHNLTPNVVDFIKSVKVDGLPELSRDESMNLCATLSQSLINTNNIDKTGYMKGMLDILRFCKSYFSMSELDKSYWLRRKLSKNEESNILDSAVKQCESINFSPTFKIENY